MTKPRQWRHSFNRKPSMRFLAQTWMEWISSFYPPMCKSCFKHAGLFLGLENGSIISLCMSSPSRISIRMRLQTMCMCPKSRSCFRTIKGALTRNNIFFVVVCLCRYNYLFRTQMSCPRCPVCSRSVTDPIPLFVVVKIHWAVIAIQSGFHIYKLCAAMKEW